MTGQSKLVDTDGLELPQELEPLKKKLLDIALEPTLEGGHTRPDSMVYHFTDESGMRGILESGNLRATRLPCFSDSQETQHPIDFCYEFLEHRQARESSIRGHFLSDVVKAMPHSEGLAHGLDDQAAACLSTRIDLSSQWKNYADNYRGYALGFNIHEVLEVLGSRVEDPNSISKVNWILRKMLYERVEKRRILDRILDTIFNSPYFSEPGTQKIYDNLIVSTLYYFGIAAAGFKHPDFAAEHEVRLTIANHLELSIAGTPLPYDVRETVNGLVEYRTVDLTHPSNSLMPIREIVIGPNANSESSQSLLKSILQARGYTNDRAIDIRQITHSHLR